MTPYTLSLAVETKPTGCTDAARIMSVVFESIGHLEDAFKSLALPLQSCKRHMPPSYDGPVMLSFAITHKGEPHAANFLFDQLPTDEAALRNCLEQAYQRLKTNERRGFTPR